MWSNPPPRLLLLLLLLPLLLSACNGGGPEYTFQNSGNGVQNVSTGGPAVSNTKSPCAGNVASTGAVSRDGGGDGSTAGGPAASSNSPDCSAQSPPIITPVIVAESPHSIAGPSLLEGLR
jgi:hypothetical protein